MQLSKSRYTQGIQCPKMLWMKKNMPEQYDDSVMNQAVLECGNEAGDLAMGYYGPFVEVPFNPNDPNRFEKAAQQTQELLAQGCPVICEATFCTEGHYCMADILRVCEDGSFDLVEVKSSTKTKPIYLHDMAYQCWVIEQCGYKIHSASLMHINNQYVRHGELDLHELFTVEDHTEEVRQEMVALPDHMQQILTVADAASEPCVPIGKHCIEPYECGFRGWCFRHLPEPNVLELSRIRKPKAFALIERGAAGFRELADDSDVFDSLNGNQQMQVLAELERIPARIDKPAIRAFLDSLWYPLYFLDFETFQEAVPSFDGERPYEQVVSQYSLHWIDAPGAPMHHTEFLGEAGVDPRRAVAEHLCEDIPTNACVSAWNMSFEKARIKTMAQLYPDLAPHLMAIYNNTRDLMVPFKRHNYYTKEMKRSASIKKVLPALFPDDPALDYHALEGVHNGGEASATFLNLGKLSPEEQAIKREQLLRYCELDTLAMVRIWEHLLEVVQ